MGRLSKFFSMKRSHESSEGSSVKKTTTFKKPKTITEKMASWFRQSEKKKYAELIEKYTSKTSFQVLDTEEKKKEVAEFTDSIRANDEQFGLPSSSSTPYHSSVRSSDTLNYSSFEILNNSIGLDTSGCAVRISPLSLREKLTYQKEIEAVKAKKSLRDVLTKHQPMNEKLASTLSKYQGKGDCNDKIVSNGQCLFAADSYLHRRVTDIDKTITLNDTITIDDTKPFGPNYSTPSIKLPYPVWRTPKEENTITLDESVRSSRYSSPLRTEYQYHTPRYALKQKTASPISISLNQSSSQRSLIHSIQEHLSQDITSPFASRSSPPIDENDFEEEFKPIIPDIELPEATTKLKQREEELDHAISSHFVINLLKEKDAEKSLLDTSRYEAERKYAEESRKTALIERQLREVELEPRPPSPFIPEFYKGVTEIEISDEEEEEEEEEEIEEQLFPSEDELDKFIELNVKKVPESDVLIDKFNIPILRKDLDTLKGLSWLNDEVMNFYFNLIQQRSTELDNYPNIYVFNTFFSSKLTGHVNKVAGAYGMVKRWTRKVDIFNHEILLIPNHIQVHWTLTAVNIRKKKISYYDSMADGRINSKGATQMETILEYLKLEHQDKKKSPLPDGWSIGTPGIDEDGNKDVLIPQQENGSDCGVFTCRFAESISRRSPFNFHQSQMPYLRKRMIYEICNGKLSDQV